MVIRADHVAGATVVGLGVLVIALSGDLPAGDLSMPGAGFLPLLVAILIIVLGGSLFFRARETQPFSRLGWDDSRHAGAVIAITVIATALYVWLGFVLTMGLMIISLLIIIERRNPLRALAHSAGVVLLTYFTFEYVLKSPLPGGLLGY